MDIKCDLQSSSERKLSYKERLLAYISQLTKNLQGREVNSINQILQEAKAFSSYYLYEQKKAGERKLIEA